MMSSYANIAHAEERTDSTVCPFVKIAVKRLPDLNIPRSAHNIFSVNGEMTVVGGHTTHFIPTATAEYYKDGEWHLMETVYPHDNGVSVVLSSGKVLLGGGHEKPLGIGQTFPVEEYDPMTHTFRGFSCLDTKRALTSGIEIDSGRVMVTGNWYADDAIEIFDGDRTFSFVKKTSVGRASPFILRTAADNALIMGNVGTRGAHLNTDVVDRLKGEPFHVPLLEKWEPLFYLYNYSSNLGFIGNEAVDDYTHLLVLRERKDSSDVSDLGEDSEVAFALVRDTTFTLLSTLCPVPTTGPYGTICFSGPLYADRVAHRGYVKGCDKANRFYVLCIKYDQRPAPLTIYYTDPLPAAGVVWTLTDEGDLMIVGGCNYNKPFGDLVNDNFSPLSSVYLLPISQYTRSSAASKESNNLMWLILPVPVLVLCVFWLLWWRRKKRIHDITVTSEISEFSEPSESINDNEPSEDTESSDSHDSSPSLILRIIELMEQQQVYLNQNLKLNDVAVMLNTNRNIISNCINSQKGISFSQFVSNYRVEHAKKLMRQQPDLKITEVWMRSGFSSESAFFRSFKTSTGMTPSEWKENNHLS
jgi:AraC-like DNA-binding protein